MATFLVEAILSARRQATLGRRGEWIMKRSLFLWLGLGCVVLASPLSAQQMAPDPLAPQTTPDQSSQPPLPPEPQAAPEPLPPFRPLPPIPPRSSVRAKHHATVTHHRARHAPKKARHAQRVKSHKKAAKHLSRRTIRQCHRMTYRQILRNKNCRELMQDSLQQASAKRHHRGKHPHKAARRHRRR